jgi:hypothetical protein
MTISNVHIYYPSIVDAAGDVTTQGVRWYDIRHVITAGDIATRGSTTMVQVAIDGLEFAYQQQAMQWSKTEFETAKSASLAAGG